MTNYISNATTTSPLIGEGEVTLPFIHKTKTYTGIEDDLIEVLITCSAGTHTVPIKFLYQTNDCEAEKDFIISDILETAKKVEPYASKILSLKKEKWKIVDIVYSHINTESLNFYTAVLH